MSIYPTPLMPRASEGILQALAMGRVSKPKETASQTEQDLQSSFAVVRQVLRGIYDGPMNLIELGEQESGLIADRATALKAMELVASGEIDLVIAEDLSKIFRNPRFQWVFVQDAVDQGTRVILSSDRVDTADPDWEIAMGVATLRHGLYIPDARRRVRRTATFAFHNGGQVQKVKFGYRKLSSEEARTGEYGPEGLRIMKLPDATSTIKTMRELLMTKVDGKYSYSPVLEYLDENSVPVGPYVKNDKWTQRLVKALLTDPVLIGIRRFRTILFDRILRLF